MLDKTYYSGMVPQIRELCGGPSACGEIFHVLTFRIYSTIQLAGRATYFQGKFLQGSLPLDFFRKISPYNLIERGVYLRGLQAS